MCGIAGVVGTEARDRGARMRAMREQLVHRGPDSSGETIDPHAALGVRRLRIIDLVTGDQPQSNEDATVWTVFNGEIYNYRELRSELTARGHRLATSSDTEVIVHLYEDLGPDFVERLDGMFAVAVWDAARRILVLARDRLGKKPLLYSQVDDDLLFASEHAALLEGRGSDRAVDPRAVRAYLRLGFVPAPSDAFAGIRKIPPGHRLVWRDGHVDVRRYWALPSGDGRSIPDAEAQERVRELITEAVRKRLVADVPIGAFLSGGVDSSVVVATMARLTSTVRTFSIGFEDAEYSELAHARRIAELFGTDHHEFIVRPLELDVLPELVRHYGEPFADSSAIPTYHLSRLTRERVTVALNGDGGDEVFAGYERYRAVQIAASIDRLPAFARRALAKAATLLPDSLSPLDSRRRARRFLQAAALTPRERYLRWLGVFDRVQLSSLLDEDFKRATETVEDGAPFAGDGLGGSDPVSAAQALDVGLYLPDDLLVKVDIASMAASLEVRSPLLDTALVEFVTRLPAALKLRGGERKRLLKRAYAGIVPRENMYRRKQGFAVPIGGWLRNDLRSSVEEVVLSERAFSRGYFRRDRLEGLVRDHTEGRADHTHRLWALLMLELWHREMVDS